MVDVSDVLKLLKEDPSLRKAMYNENQKASRKKMRLKKLQDHPEIALERERKLNEKIKLKEARNFKKPSDETTKKEREEFLLKQKEETEEARKKLVKYYVEEFGLDESMYSSIKNIQIHERPDYFIATILMNDKKFFKEESPTKQDSEDWLRQKLEEIQDDYVVVDND